MQDPSHKNISMTWKVEREKKYLLLKTWMLNK